MKIAHWSFKNGSGLHRFAEELSIAEQVLMSSTGGESGESVMIDSQNDDEWITDADINVLHSYIPDKVMSAIKRVIYVVHGTPEHVFKTSVEDGLGRGYGASDPFMMFLHYLKISNKVITFWGRHKFIIDQMIGNSDKCRCIPMGIDKSFWGADVGSKGKWAGSPAFFSAENSHDIKWALDFVIAFPEITKTFYNARYHLHYLPLDQHRWFFPLMSANGALYRSYVSAHPLSKEDLMNAFKSTDYYLNLVRYGDYNRMTLEAKSAGAKVISYAGNEYADFWVTEGDQRKIASEIISIVSGMVKARSHKQVHDISQTAKEMVKIYEESCP